MLIKAPFSATNIEVRKKIANNYWSDPVRVTKHFQFIIKQHNPDWNDIQLLLDCLTETERDLVLKSARTAAEDYYKGKPDKDIKDYFPLQDPEWDPNYKENLEKLKGCQDWVSKGMERAIAKTINWSALYAVRQGTTETPSKFLD
ncbi:hypothetical protein N320_08285, partial [Buceros rhinoceros silvestris]